MAYLGIGLVLVIGIAVVVYGWLADRTDTKRRVAAITQPPDRPIPGLDPDTTVPTYVTEREILAAIQDRAAELTDAERDQLKRRLVSAPSLPHGHAAAEFATDIASGWCVLQRPVILVSDAEITTIRELLPVMERGRPAPRPLVLVAPAIHADVIRTLLVNHVMGAQRAKLPRSAGDRPDEESRRCVAVLLPDAGLRRSLCSLVGARPVILDDLRSGYLPESVLGTCDVWVSSSERLWVVSGDEGLDGLDQP